MPTFRQDEKLGTKVPLIKTADINDKSITKEKLAEGSVTNSKLAQESVTQDKFDKELLQIFEAAAGLPKNLIETIQNIDSTLVDHQRQISSNDDDISDLQTNTKQIKDTVDGIAISGGASVGSAVTYDNTQSGLDAQNIQNAIDELVNNLGHYETNEEWLRVYTDDENKFLWGIRVDGSIDWAVGIPKPIQKAINEIIANSETFQQTLTEAMEAYKATIDEKVAAIDEKKVDKEEGKSLIDDEVKECFRVIENEEFIMAVVDSDDRVLFGIYRATGKPYFPQNDMYHISQSEEFLWVILDAANHPLLGIQQDGTCLAAKAQWLDDIKAIKEALSSIDETLKTFQPKEDGKGLINLDVADSFFYFSNDEYIIAVVDAENRILAGIKYDAQPYFPNHEMYSVITNEEWLYAIIDAEDKVLGGFRANDGHMIVGGIDISTFIANAIIDIANIKERTAHLSTTENDEYLSVETDANGKVIGYIAPDGSHYLYKVKSETIPTEFSHIEDPEGRTEITTDTEGKILGYRNGEGVRCEYKMNIDNLNVENLNLGKNAQKYVIDLINSQPKEVNVRKWHLPSYGAVNIKQETFFLTANDGYSDKTGIYPIVINEDTQENAKKGLTVLQFFVKSTLKDEGNGVYSKLDNSVGLDFYVPSKVTYVNEVPYVTSSLTKNEIDGTYSVNETSIKVTKITDSPTIGAWSVDKKTEHQCVVEIDFGHYLNGTYNIGVKYQGSSTLYNRKRNFRFTFYKDSSFSKKNKIKIGEMVRVSGFNLKANYTDNTRIKELLMNRIFMSIWEDRGKLHSYPWEAEEIPCSGATGMIKGFPIRVNIGGNFYGIDVFGLKKDEKNYLLDGDTSGMIVSGTRGNTNDPNNWTAAKPEDWEDEMNDELTESNKQALTDFFSFINSENFTKENVPQRMSVIDWIDYFIGLQVFLMRDNTCRNMILYAKEDKKKLYPFFYDLDLSWFFYDNNYNLDIMTSSYAVDMSLWENFKSLYEDEIRNRYAYLRENILSIETIQAMYEDIAKDIPLVDIALEKEKWGQGNVNSMNTYISILKKRLNWLDKEYFKI
nr:MAG: CotH kinase protein [Bacteriophage sp.]